MPSTEIAIFPTDSTLFATAEALAQELSLPVCTTPNASFGYFLLVTPEGLALKKCASTAKPLRVDFLTQKLQYRIRHLSMRHETLLRAIGVKKSSPATVIDATAGLGSDSFILAAYGLHVIMLERSPILYALLRDGLQRGLQHPTLAPIMQRMQLLQVDAIEYLKSSSAKSKIIYLDPMFPARTKSALPQHAMVTLHDIVGSASDADTLLHHALACTYQRIVVKRPRLAASLASERKPNHAYYGNSCRFDLYVSNA